MAHLPPSIDVYTNGTFPTRTTLNHCENLSPTPPSPRSPTLPPPTPALIPSSVMTPRSLLIHSGSDLGMACLRVRELSEDRHLLFTYAVLPASAFHLSISLSKHDLLTQHSPRSHTADLGQSLSPSAVSSSPGRYIHDSTALTIQPETRISNFKLP